MISERIIKSIKLIGISLIFSSLTMIFGMLRLKLFLTEYGSEMNGVYQLLIQSASYLSVAELGLFSIFNLMAYQCIANNDRVGLNKVYNTSKRVAKNIFLVMIGVSITIAFALVMINPSSTISIWIVFSLFLIICIPVCLEQLLMPKYMLLDANQDKYKYSFWFQLLTTIKLIAALIYIPYVNFYVYIIVDTSFTLLNIFIMNLVTRVQTKQLRMKEVDDEVAIDMQMSKHMVINRISTLIILNIDNIIIAKIISFVSLSIFSSYNYILTTLIYFVNMFFEAFKNSFGNLFASKDSNSAQISLMFRSINSLIASFVAIMTYFCIGKLVSFIASNTLISYSISTFSLWIITIYVFLRIYMMPLEIFVQTQGKFSRISLGIVIELIIKVVGTIVCVVIIGPFGALLATLLCKLFIAIPNYVKSLQEDREKILFREYVNIFKCTVVIFVSLIVMTFIQSTIGFESLSFLQSLLSIIVVATVFLILLCILWCLMFSEFRSVFWDALRLFKNCFNKEKS